MEEQYAEELVVVGVHSPKFVHEADPDALVAAVERYAVHHPVLDDPELTTWQAYTARAWPTLVLVDPEGYIVAQYAGEGHAHAIASLLEELVPQHRERGTLQPGDSPYVPPVVEPSDLRFPAKAVPLPSSLPSSLAPSGSVLVADAGHDEVVLLDGDGGGGPPLRRLPRAQRPVPAALGGRRAGRVRRRGRRHRRPPDRRARPGDRGGAHARRRRHPVDAGRRHRAAQQPVGRGVVAGPGVDRDGRDPPAVDLRPGDRGGRGRRGHPQRGAARRPGRHRVVRPDERARARRRPDVAGRLRDVVAAVDRGAGAPTAVRPWSTRRSGPGSSTSASATVPPTRRCSSTRSGSPSCRTGRSRWPTPTTAPYAASPTASSPRWPWTSPSRAGCTGPRRTGAASWSSSPPGTG